MYALVKLINMLYLSYLDWVIEYKIHWLMQVRVKNLRFLGSQGWELMREGEAEKQVTLLLLFVDFHDDQ